MDGNSAKGYIIFNYVGIFTYLTGCSLGQLKQRQAQSTFVSIPHCKSLGIKGALCLSVG